MQGEAGDAWEVDSFDLQRMVCIKKLERKKAYEKCRKHQRKVLLRRNAALHRRVRQEILHQRQAQRHAAEGTEGNQENQEAHLPQPQQRKARPLLGNGQNREMGETQSPPQWEAQPNQKDGPQKQRK